MKKRRIFSTMSREIIANIKTEGVKFMELMYDLTFAIKLWWTYIRGRRGTFTVLVNLLSQIIDKQNKSNLYTGFNYKDVIRNIFRILVINVTDVLVLNVTM